MKPVKNLRLFPKHWIYLNLSNMGFSNHLVGEKSPYLLQHAHNPVDWYPWGKTAFDRAQLEDKPVLLSIGYSTCHWCHVMAHESFEDQGIAKIINDHFIAIKVDREERPDIDHIYMSATTAMTGGGGWPLTVFLTGQGDPFYGGTYFPPYAKWGSVGFIDLLHSIAAAWKQDRENILSSSRSITENLRRHAQAVISPSFFQRGGQGELLLDRAFRQMKGQFDGVNGGFGSAPKFPMGHGLSFLLRYYKRRRAPEALDMVKKTLTAMAHGGIWDHLGGGFHRYSTDQNWHVPHFEKMLYDQALLSMAYLEAYQVTLSIDRHSEAEGRRISTQFAQVAREILDYVQRDITDKGGGFYSAEDADSQGVEGAFYVFSQTEIEKSLGRDSAAVFNYCYGLLPEGENILYRAHSFEEAADKFHKQTDEIQGILTRGISRLIGLRERRPPPNKDDKVLCDWNGLMIASFAFASRVLEEPKYAKAASKAADFILAHMMAGKRLLHRWRDGEAGITATLEDYAFFIYGLLEIHEATFEEKYLAASISLADEMMGLFADQAGGFYMTAVDAESLIIRPKEAHDGALPSGNSAAALILLKLYALTKNEIYNSRAEALFGCFASSVAQAPWAHSFLLSALDWHLQGPLEITFQGRKDDAVIAKMLKVLYKYFYPSKAVKFIPASRAAQAHICYRGTCKAPIDSVDVFESVIAGFL